MTLFSLLFRVAAVNFDTVVHECHCLTTLARVQLPGPWSRYHYRSFFVFSKRNWDFPRSLPSFLSKPSGFCFPVSPVFYPRARRVGFLGAPSFSLAKIHVTNVISRQITTCLNDPVGLPFRLLAGAGLNRSSSYFLFFFCVDTSFRNSRRQPPFQERLTFCSSCYFFRSDISRFFIFFR